MQEKIKTYRLILRTMAPVHIGNGESYTSKEYIYENGYYYFPDMGKLYQEVEKQGPRITEAFESFLMQSGNNNSRNSRLNDFLRQQQIKSRDFYGYKIKETGFEQDKEKKTPKGSLNEIVAFVKDPYGQVYIPGSSLKGAIRTILINSYFKTNTISWGAKKNNPFDDVFHNIRVSDSEIIPSEQLTLAQKWDYSPKRNGAKPLPIHRESLLPFTVLEFTITAIGEQAINLMEQLGTYSFEHYKEYKKKLLTKFPDRLIQKNIQYPLYLGAGSGFWTKTYIKEADPSRYQKKSGKMKMVREGALKLTKAPATSFKVKGEVRNLLENKDNFYEMGKCNFIMKEVEK